MKIRRFITTGLNPNPSLILVISMELQRYLYLIKLEEKRIEVTVPKDKFNNVTNERKALYDLKNNKNVIKKADKSSLVVVWDKADYIKVTEKQFGNEEAYEEVFNDALSLL